MSAAAVYINHPAIQDSQLQRSNNGHTYFIGILQQARDVLSAVDASRITTRTTATPVPQSKTLCNLFENLNVEETPETSLEEDAAVKPATSAPRLNFRVDIETEEQLAIQLSCILEDIGEVLNGLENTFEQQVRGEVNMEAAGLCANIAIGIIRRTWERFVVAHPKFIDYAYVLEFLGLRMETHGSLVVLLHNSGSTDVDQKSTQPKDGSSKVSENGERKSAPVTTKPNIAKLLCVSGAAIMSDLCHEARTLRDTDTSVFWYHGRHGFAQVLHTAIPELQYFGSQSWAYIPKLGAYLFQRLCEDIILCLGVVST